MQDKKQKRKKITIDDMKVPGVALAVKVIDGNLELALRLFKTKVTDSGLMEEVKARREYLKPSVVKRKLKQQAVRVEWRKHNPYEK